MSDSAAAPEVELDEFGAPVFHPVSTEQAPMFDVKCPTCKVAWRLSPEAAASELCPACKARTKA